MATRLSAALAIAACDAQVDLIDAGSGTAQLIAYNGSRPATVETAIGGQTQLAAFDLPNPAFGGAADANPGGRATLNGVPIATTGDADGTITWCRVFDRDGTAVMDIDAAELTFNTLDIENGGAVTLTGWTHTQPEE